VTCILIEVNEQGQASVGAYPSDQIPPEVKQSLQPVESVDAALEQARALIGEEQGETASQEAGENEQTEAQAEASFEKGYTAGRGTPMYGDRM
jgi:hypothetical protein